MVKYIILPLILLVILIVFRNDVNGNIQTIQNYLHDRFGSIWGTAIQICIYSLIFILACFILGKYIDVFSQKAVKGTSFSSRHKNLNAFMALTFLLILGVIGLAFVFTVLKWIGSGIATGVDWAKNVASKLDVVIIVALITGVVSLVGVIFSSVISKIIDYRKSRQEYLAQKREGPYAEFVDMIYKIQQNVKNEGYYTEEQMLSDLSKFSKQITLWGSSNVVNLWVKFRENGAKPDSGTENLLLMEKIMNEMRKDLGLKKVKKGNLLAFFVNDIKQALKKKK